MKALLAKLGIIDKNCFGAFVKQFLKFGIIGISNTLISLAVYYSFIWIDPSLYIVGSVVGWFVSVANSFFWNRYYVFKVKSEHLLKTLLKSYITYGGSFILSLGLLHAQVEWLHVPLGLAPIINIIISIPLNFLANKYWAFKSK